MGNWSHNFSDEHLCIVSSLVPGAVVDQHGRGGCTWTQVQGAAERAEDNHSHEVVGKDIHKVEAVGEKKKGKQML